MNEKMIVSCPICGRQLLRSTSSTDTEISCPKCGSGLNITVSGTSVQVKLVKMSPKQKRPA